MSAELLGTLMSLSSVALGFGWLHSQRRATRLQRALADEQQRRIGAEHVGHTQSELFRALFDSAPECVKLHDHQGRILRMNQAGLALLGKCTPEQIVGHSIFDIIAAEHHEAYRTVIDSAIAGTPGRMEFQLLTPNGGRRWLETHVVALDDSLVEYRGIIAITRDIDERKRMFDQLEEHRARLQTIIESEPECVKLQDRSGIITEMNPAGLSLLRAKSPDQVIGHPIYDFVTDEYREEYQRLSANVFRGRRCTMEFQVNTIDGDRRWLETHATPVRDRDGRVSALLAITRDIDERKQAEQKIRHHRNELAHVCRLSTLGELASGLAHELRQPLCAASSYAESAITMNAQSGERDAQRIGQILEKIVRETDRANDIVQRLRNFVQKSHPKPMKHPLCDLINDVVEMASPELQRYEIAVLRNQQDVKVSVVVDRVQTQQILLNLLYNAIQASSRATPRANRIAIEVVPKGNFVSLAVRDFADGVPPTLRDQLFTPFFTTRDGGLGLGLSLSRSLAEAQGGQLSYQPATPGSRFRLDLPRFVQQ